MPSIDWEQVERALPDPGAREALARLGAASGPIVPLVARGHTLGALGLFNREERGPLSADQVDTAVEIGRRAGLALHHARLYGQQRALADALQRSMLTEPPRAGGLRGRRPVRARGRGGRDRRRLVRRLLRPRGRSRCSRSATSSATTPAPPRRWARSAACCAASATPAGARRPRCSAGWTAPSRGWRSTPWPRRWSPAWSRTTTTAAGRAGCAGRTPGTRPPSCSPPTAR